VNGTDTRGQTPLTTATKHRHADIVSLLIEHNGVDVNVPTEDGQTAIMIASSKGHSECVRRLLAVDGIDLDAVDTNAWTALIFATNHNHEEIVSLLLEHKANVNAKCHGQLTALMIASSNGRRECARILLDVDEIETGVVDINGWTALHYAAKRGHGDIISLLLQKNADVDVQSNRHSTALMTALEEDKLECVRLLLAVDGIDVNAMDDDGATALSKAALKGHANIVMSLIEHGANVNAVGVLGPNALTDMVCKIFFSFCHKPNFHWKAPTKST
jgi:ankyrin repeat protein